MQQILNSRDRNQAFLKFSLFFIITIVLVVVAVYFNFRIPTKENKFLSNELANHRAQDEKEAEFVERLTKVTSMLTIMEKGADSATRYSQLVSNNLSEMESYENSSNIFYDKINRAVRDKFFALNKKIVEEYNSAKDREVLKSLQNHVKEILPLIPKESQAITADQFKDEIQYLPAQ